ncbi:hypothetical protein OPQ81_002038 [Rhizoctonia solani]|nr:hypothetical protein OPQ81_002038 [Rhizoctonia solani]
MAREHPTVPKASSSQKQDMRFDGEDDDDEEVNASRQNKVALAKKNSSTTDTSKLFMKKVGGREKRIKFYIVDNDVEWDRIDGLHHRIADYGGQLVKERPDEGYTLVDPRTEDGELEISSYSTPSRRVVCFLFVEESIKRGSLVPPLELALFIKQDRPVKFHLHESLPQEEIDQLRDDILLRGGNPDADLSEAQVVIHSRSFRDKLLVNRRWRQIELFETSDWLRSCMTMKRFSVTGAGGRLSVAPAPRPVLPPQPGRKPGAHRTEFTEHDDMCLVAWMAYQFGKNQAGRQGNRPYQVLVQEPEHLWWTHRHTWHSWRERYKNKKAHLDPLIIQAVNERGKDMQPTQRQLRLPKFPDSEDDESNEEEGAAQEAGPSRARIVPKIVKRKAQDASDDQPDPEPVKRTRGAKKAKVSSQPEGTISIKTSASQKAREAPHLLTPSPPARVSSFSPPTPGPMLPAASAKPVREETPVAQPEDDQELEDSQFSTPLENGILDEAVFGGARGAVERHNAELARVAADELEESDEEYTIDDPDVDVVGVTQIETPPSVHLDVSLPEEDESKTESTDESGQEQEAGETGETVLDTIEERLSALADGYGAMYSRVQAYYQHAVENGMGEVTAYDFTEKQLRADFRQEKGKGRAS